MKNFMLMTVNRVANAFKFLMIFGAPAENTAKTPAAPSDQQQNTTAPHTVCEMGPLKIFTFLSREDYAMGVDAPFYWMDARDPQKAYYGPFNTLNDAMQHYVACLKAGGVMTKVSLSAVNQTSTTNTVPPTIEANLDTPDDFKSNVINVDFNNKTRILH